MLCMVSLSLSLCVCVYVCVYVCVSHRWFSVKTSKNPFLRSSVAMNSTSPGRIRSTVAALMISASGFIWNGRGRASRRRRGRLRARVKSQESESESPVFLFNSHRLDPFVERGVYDVSAYVHREPAYHPRLPEKSFGAQQIGSTLLDDLCTLLPVPLH